jgi:hypothetical protein
MDKKECLQFSKQLERELNHIQHLRSNVQFSLKNAIQTANKYKKNKHDTTYKKNR